MNEILEQMWWSDLVYIQDTTLAGIFSEYGVEYIEHDLEHGYEYYADDIYQLITKHNDI